MNKKFVYDASPKTKQMMEDIFYARIPNNKHPVGDGTFHIYIKMYISSTLSLNSTVNSSQLLNTCKES